MKARNVRRNDLIRRADGSEAVVLSAETSAVSKGVAVNGRYIKGLEPCVYERPKTTVRCVIAGEPGVIYWTLYADLDVDARRPRAAS